MFEALATLRRLILNNKERKLLALVLAAVSWYFIQEATSFETVVTDVPLVIQIDKGWAVMDQSINSVDVLFRGTQDAIRGLSRDTCQVNMDVRANAPQTATAYRLESHHVHSLSGARAIQIQPDEILLSIDQEADKTVPVQVDTSGALPSGYEVEKVTATPATVLVHGPNQRLKEIETIRTAVVDLEGRGRTFKARVPLTAPSDQWSSRLEPLTVMVDVAIVERSAEKALIDVRVGTLVSPELGPRVSLRPVKVDLVLSGRPDLIQEVQKDEVNAYVDCMHLESAISYDLPVRVHTAPGLTVKSIQPSTVKVEIGSL